MENNEEIKQERQPDSAPEQPAGQAVPEPEKKSRAEKKAEKKADKELTEALDKLMKAEEALEKQKDALLRTAAEYDNYRKRTEREKAGIYPDATAAAVKEFLPVADNLERALAQRECADDDMRKGVEMVYAQMEKSLEKLNVEALGAPGEPFDPELHNAVSHIEDENLGENVIAQVYQKGYRIGDRVVRHAMVVVAN